MIRLSLLLAMAVCLLQSCQRDFQFVPDADKKCRLSRMTWIDDSLSTLVFSFHYDTLNRIKSIGQAPNGDSVIAYYDGNSDKLIKLRFMSGQRFLYDARITYNGNNQPTEIITPNHQVYMYYMGARLDSANLHTAADPNFTGLDTLVHFKFFVSPTGSSIGYRESSNGYSDSSLVEFTNVKNPFQHLALFNIDDFLRLDRLFPFSVFGHMELNLVKQNKWNLLHPNYSSGTGLPDFIRYEHVHDFNEKNILQTADVRSRINDHQFTAQTYQFRYDCR